MSSLILRLNRNKILSAELYKALMNDITVWAPLGSLTFYNQPLHVFRQKGILVRQGKGNGKERTKAVAFNTNMPLAKVFDVEEEKIEQIRGRLQDRLIPKYPFLTLNTL